MPIKLKINVSGIGHQNQQETSIQNESAVTELSLNKLFQKIYVNFSYKITNEEIKFIKAPKEFSAVIKGICDNIKFEEFEKLSPDVAFGAMGYILLQKDGNYYLSKSEIQYEQKNFQGEISDPRYKENTQNLEKATKAKLTWICKRIIDADCSELIYQTKLFDILKVVKDKSNFLDRINFIICNCEDKYSTIEKLFSQEDISCVEEKVKNWSNVLAYNDLDYISEYYRPKVLETMDSLSKDKNQNLFKAFYQPRNGAQADNKVEQLKDFDINHGIKALMLARTPMDNISKRLEEFEKYTKKFSTDFLHRYHILQNNHSKYFSTLNFLEENLEIELKDMDDCKILSMKAWAENNPVILSKEQQEYSWKNSCFLEQNWLATTAKLFDGVNQQDVISNLKSLEVKTQEQYTKLIDFIIKHIKKEISEDSLKDKAIFLAPPQLTFFYEKNFLKSFENFLKTCRELKLSSNSKCSAAIAKTCIQLYESKKAVFKNQGKYILLELSKAPIPSDIQGSEIKLDQIKKEKDLRHKPIITRILNQIAPITYEENYENIDKAYKPLIYKGKKISDLLSTIAKIAIDREHKGLVGLIDDLFETLIKKLNHIKLLNYIEKNISDELKLKLGILGMKGDWINEAKNEAKLDSQVIQDFIAATGEINEIDNKISSLVATILKSYKHIFLNYGKAFLTDAEIAELYQPNIPDEKNYEVYMYEKNYEVYMKVALRFLYGIDKNASYEKRGHLDLLTMKKHNAQVKMQDLTLEIFRCAQSVNYLRACDLEIKLGPYIYALDSTKTLKICKVLYTLKSRNIDNIETTFNYLINAGIDINIVDRYLENCQKIDERQKIEQCFDDFNKSKEIQKTKLMLLANNVKSDKAFERLDVLTKLLQEKQIVEKIARSKDADNLITFIAENIDYANQLFLNGTDDNPELNLFIRFADKPEVLKELNKLKESNEIAYELLSEKEDIDIDIIRGNFDEWAINELDPSNYNSTPDESFQKGNISLAMEKLGSNKDDFSIYEAFEGCRIPDEKFTSIKNAIKEGKNESILGIISDAEEYIARVDIPVGPKGYLATKFKNILLRAFKEIDAKKQHYRNKDPKSLLKEFKATKERNEKIAILRELAYRKTGLYLNHAQLFSVILQNLFGHKVAIGLPTGSGKSLIAAISSILQIDSGRTACITTTNDLLAHEAYKDFRALYSFMGIKTKLLRHYTEAFNPDKHLIIGSIRNLSFLKQKIRLNGISFGNCCILLDEFDDSIIDSNEIYQQSKPDSFLAKEKHRKIFFKMIHDNFKTIFNHANKEIDDDAIKRLVSKSTISAKDKNKILEFESIDFQILIASYLESNSLEKEKDYAIIDGEIIPIIKNKLQHESSFMYYVQQFLALKNGITIPVITRAGLSDTAADVINSFDCKILMSGTIADDNEWNLIDYPTINLESIKASKRKDCEAISFENHDEYLDHIYTRALILSQKHPVLIFAENGPSADLIYKKFKGKDVAIDTATQKQIKGKTLHGSVTSKSKEILEYANIKGHITIVTPAMSRGIDYKPSVDTGLAVIKTYASSKRLEQQELGRSGRQGAAGHTERILFGSRTSYYIKSNEEIAKKAFNDMQARMLKTYEQNILKHLTHYKKAIDNTSRYEEIKDFKSKIEHKVAQHNIFLKSTFAEHEEKFLNHFEEKYSLPNDNKVANKNLYDLIIGNFEKAMRMEIMSEPLTQEKITEDERKKIYNSIIGTLSKAALIEKYIYEKVKAEVKIEPWYSEKTFDGIVDQRDLDEIREIKQLYKEEEEQFERFLEYKVFSKLYSSEESIEKYKQEFSKLYSSEESIEKYEQEYNQKDQIDDKTKIKNYINKIFEYHNVEIPREFTQLKEKLNEPKSPEQEHFFNICKKAIDKSKNYDEFYSNCMELTAEQMPQFRKINPKKQENNYNSITRDLIFPQIEDYLERMQIKEVSNKTVTLENKENKEIEIEISNKLIGKLIGWLCKGEYKKAAEYYLKLYENNNELINGLVEELLLKIETKPDSSEETLENKNELYENKPKNVEYIDFCTYKAIEKVKNKRKWVFCTAMSIIFAAASLTFKLYEPMIAGLEAKLASISNDYYTYILIFGALCSLSTIYFIYKTFKVYYYNKKIDQPTQLNQSNGTDANNFFQHVRPMQGKENKFSAIKDENETKHSI